MNAPHPLLHLRAPRLTLNESRARALLARHGRALPVDLGAPWLATLQAAPLGEAPAPWAGAWLLQADWGGARFVLRLPAAAIGRLLEARLAEAGLELGLLPPTLAAAALEDAWSRIAAALAPLRRGQARLVGAAPDDGTAAALPHRIALELACSTSGETFAAELGTDALGLMLAAGALAARPAAVESTAPPVRSRVELGRTRLPAHVLASLQPQDVVLFDQTLLQPGTDGQHPSTHVLWLATGAGSGWRVRCTGSRIEVLEPWKAHTVAMDLDNEAEAADGDTPVALDAVPVTLSFDLGDLVMPLAELQQLVPGQTFDLGRPLAGAVRVRANGALVGHGELVEIDGRLGVALTRIGPP